MDEKAGRGYILEIFLMISSNSFITPGMSISDE